MAVRAELSFHILCSKCAAKTTTVPFLVSVLLQCLERQQKLELTCMEGKDLMGKTIEKFTARCKRNIQVLLFDLQ